MIFRDQVWRPIAIFNLLKFPVILGPCQLTAR